MATRKNIPMSKIFDYWKDKCITENGDVEIEYGYEGCDEEKLSKVDSIPVVYDWGEPSCFACNSFIPLDMIENYDELLEKDDIDAIWDNKTVSHYYDKAHIIPHSLNGESSPANLFCLCPECHKDSPDTSFPREFYRFIYNRRKHGNKESRAYQEAINEVEQIGIPQIYILLAGMNIENDFFKFATTHGSIIQESTRKSYLVGKAEIIYEKVKELKELIGCPVTIDQLNKLMFDTALGNDYKKEEEYLHQRTAEGMRASGAAEKISKSKTGTTYKVKKSDKAKEIIKKNYKEFDGTKTVEECCKLADISRNTFFKYQRQLKGDTNALS